MFHNESIGTKKTTSYRPFRGELWKKDSERARIGCWRPAAAMLDRKPRLARGHAQFERGAPGGAAGETELRYRFFSTFAIFEPS